MVKYTVRRVTVEEVEVLGDDDREAIQHAHAMMPRDEQYFFGRLALRVVEQHIEVTRREAAPSCAIDDGGRCGKPVADLHATLKERVCRDHAKTMLSAFEATPAPSFLPEPAPEEIPF